MYSTEPDEIVFPFSDDDWPTTYAAWDSVRTCGTITFSHIFYDGGYHLVAPVIDAYGAAAVAYFVLNPPTREEMLDLPAYRKKAMGTLSASTSPPVEDN